MTPDQIDLWLQIQHRQMLALERIADAVERLTPTTQAAPNYQRPLEEFANFDWPDIGAEVIRSDQYGAAIVSWRGQQFVRRSPSNQKFGDALWFSRCVGRGEDGENKYERLITFKPVARIEVEPVPEKVLRVYGRGRSRSLLAPFCLSYSVMQLLVIGCSGCASTVDGYTDDSEKAIPAMHFSRACPYNCIGRSRSH